jgi:hypothetical protein
LNRQHKHLTDTQPSADWIKTECEKNIYAPGATAAADDEDDEEDVTTAACTFRLLV